MAWRRADEPPPSPPGALRPARSLRAQRRGRGPSAPAPAASAGGDRRDPPGAEGPRQDHFELFARGAIYPSPHRLAIDGSTNLHAGSNPLRRHKIDVLKESTQRHGFWGGLMLCPRREAPARVLGRPGEAGSLSLEDGDQMLAVLRLGLQQHLTRILPHVAQLSEGQAVMTTLSASGMRGAGVVYATGRQAARLATSAAFTGGDHLPTSTLPWGLFVTPEGAP